MSASGLREDEVVLDIVFQAARILRHEGCDVILTRPTSAALSPIKGVDLAERCRIANAAHVACLVSVHANSAARAEASGYEVWTSRGDTAADALATELHHALRRALPDEIARLDMVDGDVDCERRPDQRDLAVLVGTEMPAALVEVGFLSHPPTAVRLADSAYRLTLARAIAAGVLAWGVAEGYMTR